MQTFWLNSSFGHPATSLSPIWLRGRILDVPLELTEAAEVLDSLLSRITAQETRGCTRTSGALSKLGQNAVAPLADAPFYRPPVRHGKGDQPRRACPYASPPTFDFGRPASLGRSRVYL